MIIRTPTIKIITRSCLFFRRNIHNIRNVGVVAHIDAGKTTTSEQMLFVSGEISSIGRVDDGDTVMDFLPQERERGITIASAVTSFVWKQCNINLIDTPGHVDFTIEVERAARVLDGTVTVIDAVAGVQAQTQTVWKQIRKQSIPSIVFINKMDREGASFSRSLSSVKDKLGVNAVPIQVPIGCEAEFSGVIDIISMKKILFSVNGSQSPITVKPLSEDEMKDEELLSSRLDMIESIAEVDSVFQDRYLSIDDPQLITDVEIVQALRRSCLRNSLAPVICGASLKGKGIHPLLDCIAAFLPSPADRPPCTARLGNSNQTTTIPFDSPHFCALAFKVVHDNARGRMVFVRLYAGNLTPKQTIVNSSNKSRERVHQILKVHANEYENINEISAGSVVCLIGLKNTVTGDTLMEDKSNCRDYVLDGLQIPCAVYSISVEPEKSSQQSALEQALSILQLEDPSLLVETDKESGQIILKGIGELHLEIICDKLKRQFGLTVYRGKAYVAFRESLGDVVTTDGSHAISFTYDRVLAGKRMFANVCVDVAICQTGATTACTVDIDANLKKVLTSEEMEAIRDGMIGALSRGPNGYPVCNLSFIIKEVVRDNDTTIGSLRACSAVLVDNLLRGGSHIFLEPTMNVEVDTPTRSLGDILSDLTVKRRGRIKDIVTRDEINRSVVNVQVPFAEMLGYATHLRSLTQGEGQFSMEFLEYCQVDKAIVENF